MEEILASIRKIISDDQVLPLSTRAPREEEPVAEVRPQTEPEKLDRLRPPPVARPAFDLSGSFSTAPPPRPVRPDVSAFRPQAPQPVAAPRLVTTEPEAAAPALVSEKTNSSVSSSFKVLNASRAVPEAIESAARDLLRPMLKQWLDDNLPTLVERLVRAEIERVARGD